MFGQDKAIEALAQRDQAVARRPARAGEADRLLPVLGPDRRRQDRGRQAARRPDGRRAAALRHVRVHGEAHGLAADRRAAGLRRLRPGRPADRRHRPASALRAAARRDREGASGPVQHPVAGDGPRQADRPQRQVGRLPQRHPDHDDERGRVRHGQAADGLRPHEARGRRHGGDQPHVHAGVPQPARRDRAVRRPAARDHREGGGEVRLPARGAARRPRRHDRAVGRGGEVARREGLRREVRRAAAGARDPGAHQEAARRRAAVRQARARRHGARCWSPARARSGRSPSSTSPPTRPRRPKAKSEDDDEDDDEDEPQAVLADATPRKALPGPKDKKERSSKTTGSVPTVPRRKPD